MNKATKTTNNIVRIGCGLAGYRDSEIAPLFLPLAEKENCRFDPIWQRIYDEIKAEDFHKMLNKNRKRIEETYND